MELPRSVLTCVCACALHPVPLCVSLWQVTLAGSGFDTLLAVYTGTAVNGLTLVASNDNCASGLTTSCTTFDVTVGTTYSVQVDGAGGAKGAVTRL